MKINITKKQYETLAKAVYLGNWMANAQRTGGLEDPLYKNYEEILDYVISLAPEFGFSKDFEHELECGNHEDPTEVSQIHEDYDEEAFWEEISSRLGERDFFEKYTIEEIKKMGDQERFMKRMECEIVWEEEMEEFGIERLRVLKMPKV